MAKRLNGAGTVVLSAAIATCGLFMLSGVGPSGTNDVTLPAVVPSSTEADGPSVPPVEPDPDVTTSSTTTTSTTTSTTTTTSSTTTPTPTTTTATTTAPTTTATTVPAPVSSVPLSVSASNTVVGAGGTITFDGTCAVGDDGPAGPVSVWVIGDSSDDIDVIDTGVASATWSFVWTAPTDEALFDSFTFQFWCGAPDSGGYPADLQRRVDMVASAAPPSTLALVESDPSPLIPETD